MSWRRSMRSPSIWRRPGRTCWERRRSDAVHPLLDPPPQAGEEACVGPLSRLRGRAGVGVSPTRRMNPGLLGLVAALAWGVHDVIGARVSASLGAMKTATAVTVFGLI